MEQKTADQIRLAHRSLDFIGKGNVWVENSLIGQTSVAFTQSLIARALEGTASGQLEIVVFDDALRGIAAPFQELNNGGQKILLHVNDEKELEATLQHLNEHIQAVLNVVQGRADSLLEFRRATNSQVEGFKLVVLSTDYDLLDDKIKNKLKIMMKAGPAAGVTFLVHSMSLGVNEYILELCQHCYLEDTTVRDAQGDLLGTFDVRSAEDLIALSRAAALELSRSSIEPVAFGDVEDLNRVWHASSRDGISFAVGTYGVTTIEVTLGDELNQRHNALITGAVGQGKSNLISVIVHSLCQRYSPDEVQFYMLDFKEGVTLQTFAPQENGTFLPHARVLGVDADREYGLNVLKHLFRVYKERMARFKESGVQSIRQYRLKNPEAVMPRIVAVVDEFQMLFADKDDIADEAADLLVKGARLFRASGIHFILSSQTIGGNLSLAGSTGEGLFGQVPVRIALKNSLTESFATLGLKNDAASHLKAREAIVNLDYGELSANRKTRIAYADEAVLGGLREIWWKRAAASRPPEVFEGERVRSLSDDERFCKGAQAGEAMLGLPVTVDSAPLSVSFAHDVGRNLALFGTGKGHAELLSIALSLAHGAPRADFAVLDLVGTWQSVEERGCFERRLRDLGKSYTLVPKDGVDEFVADLAAQLEQEGAVRPQPLYVLGFGMERWRTKSSALQKAFKAAATGGVHFLLWWTKFDSFKDCVGYGGDNDFDIRVVMQLEPDSARQVFKAPLLHWLAKDNRILVWDSATMSRPRLVIPYGKLE